METRRESLLLVLAVLCVAITAVTSFSLRRDKMLLRTVLQEVAELRAELESRDKTVSELQAKVEESFQRPLGQTPPPSADSFAELARRFDQLTTQQNKTLALVQSLASTGAQDESPVLRQQRRQLGIGSLEDKLKTQQESLDAAKQKADQLATIWNVPDEVSRMEVSAGLDSEALKPYWPYFEARRESEREREQLQRFLNILKMKLEAEKLDLDDDAAKGVSQ